MKLALDEETPLVVTRRTIAYATIGAMTMYHQALANGEEGQARAHGKFWNELQELWDELKPDD